MQGTDLLFSLIENLDLDRLGTRLNGMGGATKAKIVGAISHFDMVENRLVDLTVFYEMACRLANRQIDRPLVVGCGNDDIGIGNNALTVGIIMMDEGTAGRLDNPDPFAGDFT